MSVRPKIEVGSLNHRALKELPTSLDRLLHRFVLADLDRGQSCDPDPFRAVRDGCDRHPQGTCAFCEERVEGGDAHLEGRVPES